VEHILTIGILGELRILVPNPYTGCKILSKKYDLFRKQAEILAGSSARNVFYIFHCEQEEEMKSNALLNLGLFMLIVFSIARAASDQPEVAWIRDNAVKLQMVEAGHGFEDMQPLKKIVGDAKIVSLGEATHGTREFFQLKHRMLEFLATNMGFNIFSIEANMPEAYRLNDFVLNGRGDPARLIKGMYFWTWDTQEVLDMILWMREFNKSGKGRLQFSGFDMQTPNVAAEIVDDFVAGADPDYAKVVRQDTDKAKTANPAASGGDFGLATGTFPVKGAAGKHIRFSGYIKTEGVTTGYAGLWWRVDGPSGVLAFDNMQSRGVSGTTDWRSYDIELHVAAEARNINFGALFPGDGTAWFDELTVELDGKPYTNNDIFDFGFESPSPKGFYTGRNGYRVQLDSQVFHRVLSCIAAIYYNTTSGQLPYWRVRFMLDY
jgi:hypothetical protein